jgi:hypothetical protein
MIHFLLIFTGSETFQQTSQTILQNDLDSADNHFLGETEMFLFLSESETVSNIPLFLVLQVQLWIWLIYPQINLWYLAILTFSVEGT